MSRFEKRVEAARRAFEGHQWNPTTRLCTCGEFFEASLVGHDLRDAHRMGKAISAADAVCCAHPKCPGGSLCCCQSDAVVTVTSVETCAWCPSPARGDAWHNDGKLHPSCGQVDHGQGWVPGTADAVVTEEMIAETILKALVFTNENSEVWADGLARDIAALFRGGAK